MKKAMLAAISAVTAMSFALSAVSVEAQPRDRGWDRDRGHHDGRWDRRDDRRWDRGDRHDNRRWRNWGGGYGYNGYNGRWRTGQRYNYWRNQGYYLNDWRAYGLPAPRPGYRYYRDNSGDIVMAAIATGMIVSILTR